MINENFKPVEHKFVEIPYAEMLKHGMAQQANYDEAVGAMAEYDAKLGALKRIDEDTYQRVVSKYDQDFRDMYDQYGGDWGAMKNRVKQRLGAETANPYYNLNRAHVEEYDKMQDLNRQLRAAGKSPLTFSKVPLSLIKDGKLIKAEDIKYNIEGKLGWDEKEREIANFALQEEHNSGETSLAGLTDEDVVRLGNKLYLETVKTTTSGIGEKQILNKIDNMYTNFMDSDEGKQKYRALMNSEEFGIKGATPRLVEAKIKEDLLKTAYLKIHQSYDVDRQTVGNAAYVRGGDSQLQVNPFSIATTNSPNPVNERPADPNSVVGKFSKISELLKPNSIINSSFNKNMNPYELAAMAGKNVPSTKQKVNNANEAIKLFNSMLSENSSLKNIAMANRWNIPNEIKTIEEANTFMNNPIFQIALNSYDNLNRYYVGKDVIINQNDEAAKGVGNAIKSKPENYKFKTADGNTVEIPVKDRKDFVTRLDLVTGDIKTTIDGKDLIIDASEIQNTAGDAMKNIIYANKAFQSDHDGEKFLGAGNVPYETIDAARYATPRNYDPKSGMIRIATSTGKIETIPISSKLAIGYAKNSKGKSEPVLYTYDDVIGGLAGQTLGATGVNSKVVEGKIQ